MSSAYPWRGMDNCPARLEVDRDNAERRKLRQILRRSRSKRGLCEYRHSMRRVLLAASSAARDPNQNARPQH